MRIIKLDGYNATVDDGKKLELGTFDSYGEEQLQIVKAQNWENLSVIATFNPPNKKPVQVVVDSVTGVIKVPKEATANLYGVGTIVFAGLADGVQRISADVEYIVRKHSNANGTEPAEPTPSVVEQILTEAQNANTNSAEAKKLATNAKDIAQSVRDDADNGKFNGKDGAKGDKGETGTTPRLKIGEDNLWHVSYDNGATWVSLGVKATGATGEDGADGLTPYIGENGNWWLGDTDTGVSAKGPKGDPGPDDLVIVTYENGKLSKTYDELLADINANKIVAIKDVGSQKFPYYLYDYLDNTYGLFFSASPRLQASPYQRIFLPFMGVKSDNTITANLGITSGTVPSAGKTGQVLAKKSDKSYVVQWVDMPDVSQLEEDVTKLKEDATALSSKLEKNEKRAERAEATAQYAIKMQQGYTYESKTVVGSGSKIDVPVGAKDYAGLRKIGGMSRKGYQLLQDDFPVSSSQLSVTKNGNYNYTLTTLTEGIYRQSGNKQSASGVAGMYTLHAEIVGAGGLIVRFFAAEEQEKIAEITVTSKESKRTISVPNDFVRISLVFIGNEGKAIPIGSVTTISSIMLEPGNTAHRFEPYIADLITATVDSVVSKRGSGEVIHTTVMPPEMLALCQDYGQGTDESYNYIDFETKSYHHVGSMTQNGVWEALDTPEIINLSAAWPDNLELLTVASGGTVQMHYPKLDDEFEVAVPSEIVFLIDIAKVIKE